MPKQEHGVGKPKLRIALFGARGLPHTYGGAEAFFLELAPRLVQRGHEVIVYNRRSLFREKPVLQRREAHLSPKHRNEVLGYSHAHAGLRV